MSPSGASWPDRSTVLVLLALLFLGRALVAILVPLAPDEAYYALWGRNLALGYFDHPPMIAWFVRGGTAIFGETPLGVRLVCVLSVIPTSWFIWRAAARLVRDEQAGPLAALLYNLTLLGYFGMAVATPDVPLSVFAAAMIYVAARLLDDDRPALWLAMGVVTGLAFLSKYSAALLAGGFSIAVLMLPAWRRKLATPWPWLALATAVLVFVPNILWNVRHDWATFAKQGGRVAENTHIAPGYILEFVGAQFGLLTPLIFILAVVGLLPAYRDRYRSVPARRLLLIFVVVPVAYFLFHALRSRVEGNWPGFLYPALSISAAAAMISAREGGPRWLVGVSRLAVPVGLVLALVGSFYVALSPLPALGRRDPIQRTTRGWSEFAADVDQLRRAVGASYVLTYDYQLNAELALHLPDVAVAQYNDRERYATLGGTELSSLGGTGLLLSRMDILPALRVEFGTAEPVGELDRNYGGTRIERLYAYRIERPAVP